VQRWMVDLRQHPVLRCNFKDTLMKRETLLYRFPGGHRAIAVGSYEEDGIGGSHSRVFAA
jgi:hypothetical protein